MRVFILQDSSVVVGELIITEGSREEVRQAMLKDFSAQAVWFDDEIGTSHDPINGSDPTIRRTINFRNN